MVITRDLYSLITGSFNSVMRRKPHHKDHFLWTSSTCAQKALHRKLGVSPWLGESYKGPYKNQQEYNAWLGREELTLLLGLPHRKDVFERGLAEGKDRCIKLIMYSSRYIFRALYTE